MAHELAQLLVATDLSGTGIVDHDLTRPHGLENAGVTFVQCSEVLRNGISLTSGANVPSRKLDATDEVRKPRHFNPCSLPARNIQAKTRAALASDPSQRIEASAGAAEVVAQLLHSRPPPQVCVGAPPRPTAAARG
jgi:hypothetical protein